VEFVSEIEETLAPHVFVGLDGNSGSPERFDTSGQLQCAVGQVEGLALVLVELDASVECVFVGDVGEDSLHFAETGPLGLGLFVLSGDASLEVFEANGLGRDERVRVGVVLLGVVPDEGMHLWRSLISAHLHGIDAIVEDSLEAIVVRLRVDTSGNEFDFVDGIDLGDARGGGSLAKGAPRRGGRGGAKGGCGPKAKGAGSRGGGGSGSGRCAKAGGRSKRSGGCARCRRPKGRCGPKPKGPKVIANKDKIRNVMRKES